MPLQTLGRDLITLLEKAGGRKLTSGAEKLDVLVWLSDQVKYSIEHQRTMQLTVEELLSFLRLEEVDLDGGEDGHAKAVINGLLALRRREIERLSYDCDKDFAAGDQCFALVLAKMADQQVDQCFLPSSGPKNVMQEAGIQTSGKDLCLLLEKTGARKATSGAEKLDVLVWLADQVKYNVEKGRQMQLALTELVALLQCEGEIPHDTANALDAKSVIVGLLSLRRREIARLSYDTTRTAEIKDGDQCFALVLAKMPDQQVHQCFLPSSGPKNVMQEAGIKTSGKDLCLLLEKTGARKATSGAEKLDVLAWLADQVKYNVAKGRQMQLALTELVALLQCEGEVPHDTANALGAKSVIMGLLSLRHREIARLSYDTTRTADIQEGDRCFELLLVAMPDEQVDRCFAEECVESSVADTPRSKVASCKQQERAAAPHSKSIGGKATTTAAAAQSMNTKVVGTTQPQAVPVAAVKPQGGNTGPRHPMTTVHHDISRRIAVDSAPTQCSSQGYPARRHTSPHSNAGHSGGNAGYSGAHAVRSGGNADGRDQKAKMVPTSRRNTSPRKPPVPTFSSAAPRAKGKPSGRAAENSLSGRGDCFSPRGSCSANMTGHAPSRGDSLLSSTVLIAPEAKKSVAVMMPKQTGICDVLPAAELCNSEAPSAATLCSSSGISNVASVAAPTDNATLLTDRRFGLHALWQHVSFQVSLETVVRARAFLDEQGAVNISELCRYDLVDDFVECLDMKPIPKKKCLTFFAKGADELERLLDS